MKEKREIFKKREREGKRDNDRYSSFRLVFCCCLRSACDGKIGKGGRIEKRRRERKRKKERGRG